MKRVLAVKGLMYDQQSFLCQKDFAPVATAIYLCLPFTLGNILQIYIFVQLSGGSKHDSLV